METIITRDDYRVALANGISHVALRYRVKRGWDMDKAVSTPLLRVPQQHKYKKYTMNDFHIGQQLKLLSPSPEDKRCNQKLVKGTVVAVTKYLIVLQRFRNGQATYKESFKYVDFSTGYVKLEA